MIGGEDVDGVDDGKFGDELGVSLRSDRLITLVSDALWLVSMRWNGGVCI